ncbi:MAG: glycosyltransferase family 39 protein, partial [Candidatus Taylorbacteria bacterium]|nr:glycosyltransferase family 39 protein [Candidatus Taylorbacteria bacterium]
MTQQDSGLQRKVPDFFALLAVAFVVYISLLFFVVSLGSDQVRAGENPRFVYPVHGSDSAGYVVLADNILEQKVFSQDAISPFTPDTFRTPGYPFFLALFKFVFGSYTWFPLIQILCTVGVSFMVLRMGERLFSRTVGMIGAFLYLLDPTVILHSLVLLSDSTYVFLVVLTVYLLFFKSKEGSARERTMVVATAGVVLGISVLARPISMFLPAVLLPFYIFSVRADLSKKKIAQNTLLFIFGLCMLTVPWLVRNKNAVGVWGLSSVASFNLFFYYVPEFLAYDTHTSPDAMRARMQAELPADVPLSSIALLQNTATINKISLKYLSGHVVDYTKFHLVKTIPVFLSSGMKH